MPALLGRFLINICQMFRPLCLACNQRPRAIAYHTDTRTQYRRLCEHCIKKNKKIKVPEPRWKASGYKKKPTCDLCGFRARYSAQLLVFHIDGNLHNTDVRNLKTICLNCVEEVKRSDSVWKSGDLEPDA
jgi:hypothetical protein